MKHRICILLAAALVLAARADAATSPFPLDQDDRMEDLGAYYPSWFSETLDVELSGDRALVFGVGGLSVFDISDPLAPILVGRHEPPRHPSDRYYRGAVEGSLAVAGGREDLLTIFDLSAGGDPVSTIIHGQPGDSYEGATIRDGIAYACRHAGGLEILDINDPYEPVVLGTVPELTNAWDVVVAGDLAYVADGAGGLAVVDITDLEAPFLVRSVTTEGVAADVAISGSIVVTANGSAGIEVFSLADPRDPVSVGSANTSGLAATVDIAGDLVFVADWDDVEVFDISDPANPSFYGGEDTATRAMGLAAREDLVAVADWASIRFFRPGPTSNPDLQLNLTQLHLAGVEVGATVDTSFVIGNTGGAPLGIYQIEEFGDNFEILDPGPMTIPVGETRTIGLRYTQAVEGFDATFVRILAYETDETQVQFPVTALDHPWFLDVGDQAPTFTHTDMGGVEHTLENYRGRVVVLAFLANW